MGKVLGALEVVRADCRRLEVAETVDRLCPLRATEGGLSHRQVIEALIANRLTSPLPLYEIQEWARCFAVEEVFGIFPDQLNDDRLGRALKPETWPQLDYVSERERKKPPEERIQYWGTERDWQLIGPHTGAAVTFRKLFILSSEERDAGRKNRTRQREREARRNLPAGDGKLGGLLPENRAARPTGRNTLRKLNTQTLILSKIDDQLYKERGPLTDIQKRLLQLLGVQLMKFG